MPGGSDTPTQLRCDCGNLLARGVPGGVEINAAAVNGKSSFRSMPTLHQSAEHLIQGLGTEF